MFNSKARNLSSVYGSRSSDSGMHTHTCPPEMDMGEENQAALGLLRREDVCVLMVAV
jgi:hypothetical protein